MSLRSHMRAHGAVHALWTISLLVLIVASLLLGLPNGNLIGDYIAFAASIASLVLAVVAIFYSIISNQSFSETVGTLKSSAEIVKSAADRVCDVSMTLNDQSERLINEVLALPPAVQAISDKIDTKFAPSSNALDSEGKGQAESDQPLNKIKTVGAILALYVVGASYRNGKEVDADLMLPKHAIWSNYVAGFLHSLYMFCPGGIGLVRKNNTGTGIYTVTTLGKFKEDDFFAQIAKNDSPDLALMKSLVDNYFSGEISSVEDAAGSGYDG